MGKRSDFARRPQDCYDTPPEAVVPLIGHLPRDVGFWEPCAGKGDLARALHPHANCLFASDIEPRHPDIARRDALQESAGMLERMIITNPPWTRDILHPMIEHFSAMRPTWLLFDSDWAHTKQAAPYLKLCRKIVSVGRVKWIPDSKHTGKDNAAWFYFDAKDPGPIEFFGRQP